MSGSLERFNLLNDRGQIRLPELRRLAESAQAQSSLTQIGGDFLQCSSGTLLNPSPVSTVPVREFYHQVGTKPAERWYNAGMPFGETVVSSAGINAVNTIYALPFIDQRGGTIDNLGIWVKTTAGTGTLGRLGIYESVSTTDLTPSNLIVDGGNVPIDSLGLQVAPVNLTFVAGKLYWFCYLFNDIPNLAGCLSSFYYPILGLDALATNLGFGWQAPLTFGALPAVFPANPTVLTVVNPAFNFTAFIACRFSA